VLFLEKAHRRHIEKWADYTKQDGNLQSHPRKTYLIDPPNTVQGEAEPFVAGKNNDESLTEVFQLNWSIEANQ
jgi:hypothetical protein